MSLSDTLGDFEPGPPKAAPPRPGHGSGYAPGCLLMVLPPLALVVWFVMLILTGPPPPHRSLCTNNLKQIAIALHSYQDAEGSLPPAYTLDARGNPGLSWRVLILPYMEQAPLYGQFKLDEPWDSPANQALLPEIPRAFRCPIAEADGLAAGDTTYTSLSGPEQVGLPTGGSVG